MSYQVMSRKYRSQTFQDLVGQEHITQTLINAIRTERFPHALLFCGTRGVGKTSSARILAKTLICPNITDFKPCNQCAACVDITAGSHMDVIEIDGASNNGVDAIRELRETVGYSPSNGKYKIYIIDEVHMLSTSAFNALLKTLEEPPSHVIFVLATTEAQKIPITILSRCQRFDFRKIATRSIQLHLENICQQENLNYDKEALWLLARLGDGSMRDALSLLEQANNFTQGQITLNKVTDVLGLTDQKLLQDTLRSLLSRDLGSVVKIVEKIFDKGVDPIVFVESLLENIRHLLLAKISENPTGLLDISESEIDALKAMAINVSQEDIHLLFDMCLKGSLDLLKAQNPRIVLEMLLLRMSQSPRIEDIEGFLNDSTSSQNKAQVSKAQYTHAPNEAIPSQVDEKVIIPTPKTTTVTFDKIELSDWEGFVSKVKMQNPILGTQLEHTALAEITSDTLKLEVSQSDHFFYDQLKDTKQLEKIKVFVKTFCDKDLMVQFSLQNEAMSPKLKQGLREKEKEDKIQIEIENHPLVSKIKKSFTGKITDIQQIDERKN